MKKFLIVVVIFVIALIIAKYIAPNEIVHNIILLVAGSIGGCILKEDNK